MKKFTWIVALLAAFTFVFFSCGDGGEDTTKDEVNATWTVTQKGGTPGTSPDDPATATTTHIVITFNKEVELKGASITISGAATRSGSPVKGQGNSWEVAVDVTNSGNANVAINQTGVVSDTKGVVVYKQGGGSPPTYDYYFVEGTVKFYLEDVAPSITIEKDVSYDITLSISELATELVGGHFGAQLLAENSDDEEEDFLIGGWMNGTPNTVEAGAKDYTWTFVGGDKNSDGSNTADFSTIPSGAKQYFKVTVQVPAWGTNISGTHGFNATVTIEKAPVYGGLALDRELNTGSDWDYRENGANKGKISASTAAEIKALPDGSVLRVYITGTVFDSSGNPRPGWGVGTIGGKSIDVPGDAVGSAAGTSYSGYVDILTKDIGLESDQYSTDIINVNIYSGFVIDKIEIWSIGGGLALDRELNTGSDWDYRENGANKGKISASTAAEIKALPDGSVLRVYITGTVFDSSGNPQPGWGVGTIGGKSIDVPGDAVGSAAGTSYSGYVDILTKDIGLESDQYSTDIINVNIYSGFTITKIEIWKMGS